MSTFTQSPLEPNASKIVVGALQDTLVDLLDLSLLAKQAHWNVVGPRFRPIHEQLDEVADSARRYSDTVAERAVAIGIPAEGRAATIAKESGLPQVESGWIGDDDVVAKFVEILGVLVERLRRRVAATGEPDPVSQDLLIAVTAEIEKAHWMWRAQTT
jgi:starvation-inducible DNA-binding protein